MKAILVAALLVFASFAVSAHDVCKDENQVQSNGKGKRPPKPPPAPPAPPAPPVEGLLLNGKTISSIAYHGASPDKTTIMGPVTSVVGAGVELTGFSWNQFLSVDFSDTSILITVLSNQPFGYFEIVYFYDALDNIAPFTGVAVNPATNYAGFSAANVSFNADSIVLGLTGLQGLQGQIISLSLVPPAPSLSQAGASNSPFVVQ